MLKSFRILLAALVATIALSALSFAQDEEKKPKHAIKDVMKNALAPKGKGLNKKVLSGKASTEEKLELLDLYISLIENEPPRGEVDSWQRFAGAAALAAAKVAVGREDGLKELKTATKCATCHKAHKPPSR